MNIRKEAITPLIYEPKLFQSEVFIEILPSWNLNTYAPTTKTKAIIASQNISSFLEILILLLFYLNILNQPFYPKSNNYTDGKAHECAQQYILCCAYIFRFVQITKAEN